jgi:temperature dependent protein affecting M2 dsRNA replication
MLSLRGFVAADHTLTPWGRVLFTMLSALPALPPERRSTLIELEEAVVVATELLRLGLLNAKDMFPMYGGAPYNKDEVVNRNTLLIARVACLGSLAHQEIGYSGPLSRHLLGYHSMTTAVRESLRDMAEVCLVSLLFNGDVVRDRNDYGDLGYEYVSSPHSPSLPF